ncbi:hypothetical protein [Vibrio breoganii]|uniref:hypothetical protein n=1 Tax=Vibrio breoganii TaxID=553239 RepID=UPI000C819D7E|nr:hypothetical protein [Vibrio breoganii]PMG06847.1 hypothetical protein BCV08_04745 [Vibrio breoganii]PMH15779.1 hypothetical protein BCU74_14090 [Vibrio breoganii]PMM11047.1 hypothetical protein BCT60_16960 [Vibrio breoganii]PMO55335.1 hypothetical protein BCT07_15375 [Vibrio breoganii]TKG21750.1 hypothetical protein FCV81_08855 [Vibrio breoganii]
MKLKTIEDSYWSGYLYKEEFDLMKKIHNGYEPSAKQLAWMEKAEYRVQQQIKVNDPYVEAKASTVGINDLFPF